MKCERTVGEIDTVSVVYAMPRQNAIMKHPFPSIVVTGSTSQVAGVRTKEDALSQLILHTLNKEEKLHTW